MGSVISTFVVCSMVVPVTPMSSSAGIFHFSRPFTYLHKYVINNVSSEMYWMLMHHSNIHACVRYMYSPMQQNFTTLFISANMF